MMNKGGWSFCFNCLFFEVGDHENAVNTIEFTYDKMGAWRIAQRAWGKGENPKFKIQKKRKQETGESRE